MDPNETLKRMIELSTHVINAGTNVGVDADTDTLVFDLAQAVLDLDAWMRDGGFLPAAWNAGGPWRKGGPAEVR